MQATERQSTRQETSDFAYRLSDLSESRRFILYLIRTKPRTCDEVMEYSGTAHQSASAALNWLMRNGYVVDSGLRRPTRSGRDAIVWEAVEVPVPIMQARPTRKELERRVEAALRAIADGASDVRLEQILKGGQE